MESKQQDKMVAALCKTGGVQHHTSICQPAVHRAENQGCLANLCMNSGAQAPYHVASSGSRARKKKDMLAVLFEHPGGLTCVASASCSRTSFKRMSRPVTFVKGNMNR